MSAWSSALKKSNQVVYAVQAAFCRPSFPQHQVDWARLVSLDFETYFDDAYTLKKLSTSEYIRDKRFKAQMVGIKLGTGKTRYFTGARIKAELNKINWSTHGLLCHNVQFDGFILSHHYGIQPAFFYDTLSMARGLHSNDIGAGLDEVAIYYGGKGKIDGILEKTRGVLNWPKPLVAEAGKYCVNDVDEMYRIFKLMLPKMPDDEMHLIDIICRMFTRPLLKVDIPRVEAELKRELDRRDVLMASVLDPTLYYADKTVLKTNAERLLTGKERDDLIVKRIVGSSDKFAGLLRAEGVEPPVKISPAWIKKPKDERVDKDKLAYAFAKDDADFINLPNQVDSWGFDLNKPAEVKLMAVKQARLQNLVDVRIAVKSTTNVTRAQRFLTAGADGMALPCGYAYYRAHCVPGSTEVLTRQGWVSLDAWDGGEIAQVHPDQRIEFLPGTKFKGPVESDWLQIHAPYLKCDFTLGHTMPYFTQKGRRWVTEKAGNLLHRNTFDVPISGVLSGTGAITAEQMRVLVMVQADGSFETDTAVGRRLCVFVKKPRKIARARQLFAAAGVEFKEQTYPSHPDMVRFIVRHADYPHWLSAERKFFGPWLLDSTAEAREVFLSELQHWDGYTNHAGCICYSTSDEINAEWSVTMAHLGGKAASIYRASAKGSRRANYTVSFRDRSFVKIQKQDKYLVHAPQPTFCATTQTGFWLARSGGRIFITGNTGRLGGQNKMNMQNLTRGGELRLSIIAPKGYQVAVQDSGQIEARVNAWLWGQDDLLEAFQAADAGLDRDAYCKFGDSIYGRDITKADKVERHVSKTAVLGLGYQMGAAKFQITLAKGANGGPPVYFTLDQCKAIVNTYRNKNYAIANGWDICKGIIEDMAAGREGAHGPISWEKETVWLPNGMALKYPDLRKAIDDNGWDQWTYQSKDQRKKIYGGLLTENIVQALARIIVMWQTLQISRKYPIVMSTHDEVVTLPKTAQAQRCIDFMAKWMSTSPAWCSDLPLNCEGGFAANYSK